MKWPWTRKPRRAAPASDDVADAVAARRHAEAALARERAREREVHTVSAAARSHRTVNHFAQLISDTFRGPM